MLECIPKWLLHIIYCTHLLQISQFSGLFRGSNRRKQDLRKIHWGQWLRTADMVRSNKQPDLGAGSWTKNVTCWIIWGIWIGCDCNSIRKDMKRPKLKCKSQIEHLLDYDPLHISGHKVVQLFGSPVVRWRMLFWLFHSMLNQDMEIKWILNSMNSIADDPFDCFGLSIWVFWMIHLMLIINLTLFWLLHLSHSKKSIGWAVLLQASGRGPWFAPTRYLTSNNWVTWNRFQRKPHS